jgi:curli biogenesis system outer membrane secretion channel CsgG
MTRTPLLVAIAAAAALAGCGKENHTIVAGPDAGDNSANTASAAPVQLPPSIAASKSYRCKDNKVIYVDWLSDGSARVKTSKEDVGTAVAAGAADLTGDAKASSITYKGQSCKA